MVAAATVTGPEGRDFQARDDSGTSDVPPVTLILDALQPLWTVIVNEYWISISKVDDREN
jgi:hypothetical protein